MCVAKSQQIPGSRAPWRLNFVWWRFIFVGL